MWMHQCLSSRVSLLQTWFKPQHDAWLIRGRFRVFCSLVKLALWLRQRYVKTQQIIESIRCIGNCRLLNYIFSHKNNFWCLRKPTRVTPPSYPQGSLWSWWCLNRVNNRIICKVLKICHVGQPFWHCLGRPVLLPLISFLMDIAKNTLWTYAPKGSKADTMYHVVSKLNWHPKDATGLEARQHPLWGKKQQQHAYILVEGLVCIDQTSHCIFPI